MNKLLEHGAKLTLQGRERDDVIFDFCLVALNYNQTFIGVRTSEYSSLGNCSEDNVSGDESTKGDNLRDKNAKDDDPGITNALLGDYRGKLSREADEEQQIALQSFTSSLKILQEYTIVPWIEAERNNISWRYLVIDDFQRGKYSREVVAAYLRKVTESQQRILRLLLQYRKRGLGKEEENRERDKSNTTENVMMIDWLLASTSYRTLNHRVTAIFSKKHKSDERRLRTSPQLRQSKKPFSSTTRTINSD